MAETIIYEVPNFLRTRTDPATNKLINEFWNSSTAKWETVEQTDVSAKLLEVLATITQNVTIKKSEPRLICNDTASGGAERRFVSSGGKAKIKDADDADVMNLEAHQARHIKGGADELSGLTKAQLAADTIQFGVQIPIIAESARTGLAADATGVKWTSIDIIPTAAEIQSLKGAYIEATWTASATDSVTAIELYDATAAAVKTSVSGNKDTNKRSAAASLTADNILNVRVNVTTASATAGATTDVSKAMLILVFGAS